MTLFHLTAVLLVIWILSMAWMRREQRRSNAPAARWIETAQGGLWVACATLPQEGHQVRANGHHGNFEDGYRLPLSGRGTLGLQQGVYHWENSGLRPYT